MYIRQILRDKIGVLREATKQRRFRDALLKPPIQIEDDAVKDAQRWLRILLPKGIDQMGLNGGNIGLAKYSGGAAAANISEIGPKRIHACAQGVSQLRGSALLSRRKAEEANIPEAFLCIIRTSGIDPGHYRSLTWIGRNPR
jgi:hypothetical protein